MLHYQNVNEVSEATGDQTSEIPLTENHHGIGQNFMLPVRLPVLGLHGKKMPSFSEDGVHIYCSVQPVCCTSLK